VIGGIYNSARILTGSRKMAWDDIVQTAKGNAIVASNLGGSQTGEAQLINKAYEAITGKSLFDVNTRSEFLRRYNAGENPDYLVAELANPLIEMGYDLVNDPFNLIGGVIDDMAKAAKLASTKKKFDTLPELVDGWTALKGVQAAGDDVPILADMAAKVVAYNSDAASAITKTSEFLNPNLAKATGPKDLARVLLDEGAFSATGLLSPNRLNSRGKANAAADVIGNTFGVLMGTFKDSPDDLGEILHSMALIGGQNVDEVRDGLQIASKTSDKMAQLITSPEGMQTAQFMNKIATGEDGAMSYAIMDDIVAAMKNGKTTPEIIEKWEKISSKIYDEMYPSVIEMAKQPDKYNVPDWALSAAKLHQATQDGWNILGVKLPGVQGLNGALSTMYITTNPGAGFRNLLNNVFTTAIDYGPGAARDAITEFGVKVGNRPDRILNEIETMLGFVPGSATRGLGKGTGGGAAEDGSQFIKAIAGLTDKGERATSEAITFASLKRTLRGVLKEGAGIAQMDDLRKLGVTEDQLNHLVGLTQKYNDPAMAIQKWLGEADAGVLDTFRDIRAHLKPDEIKGMNAELLKSVEQILDAPDIKTAKDQIAKLRQYYKNIAKKADGQLPSHLNDSEMVRARENGMSEEAADAWTVRKSAQDYATNVSMNAISSSFENAFYIAAQKGIDKSILAPIAEAWRKSRDEIFDMTELNATRAEFWRILRENQGKPDRALNMLKQLPEWDKYVGDAANTSNFRQLAFESYLFPRQQKIQTQKMGKAFDAGMAHLFNAGGLVGENLLETNVMKLAMDEIESVPRNKSRRNHKRRCVS
jgi:hypothetical protein